MKTINTIIYTNATYREQQALSVDGEIVLQGTFDSDNIDILIEGFILGLKYNNIVTVTCVDLKPEDMLFELIEFIDTEGWYLEVIDSDINKFIL